MCRMRCCALNAASRPIGRTSQTEQTAGIYRLPKLSSVWGFGLQWVNGFIKPFLPAMCSTAEHFIACRLQFTESSSSPQSTWIIALFNSWAFCKSGLALEAFYAWLSLDISQQAGFGWDVDLQEELILVNEKHDHTHFSETCTATTIFSKHRVTLKRNG